MLINTLLKPILLKWINKSPYTNQMRTIELNLTNNYIQSNNTELFCSLYHFCFTPFLYFFFVCRILLSRKRLAMEITSNSFSTFLQSFYNSPPIIKTRDLSYEQNNTNLCTNRPSQTTKDLHTTSYLKIKILWSETLESLAKG